MCRTPPGCGKLVHFGSDLLAIIKLNYGNHGSCKLYASCARSIVRFISMRHTSLSSHPNWPGFGGRC